MIRLIALFFAVIPLFSYSSIQVNGQLLVSKSCPAYLSKNKKNNPDQLFIQPGQQYEIKEINRFFNPEWLRIKLNLPSANSLRWVNIDCGKYNYQLSKNTSCNLRPGMADSYVLALSWQPAFCQAYGHEKAKPECLQLRSNSFQASHLVLHGLWPSQRNCGQQYSYCHGSMRHRNCDYPALSLSATVASNLKEMMPSYAHGSCLERYEWNKHGSCQSLSADDYYSLAIRLNKEANQTALGQFLHEHLGYTVQRGQLREMIRRSFGPNTTRKVYLGCKKGMLVDIYIQLPALIPANESLQALVQKAPDFERYESCPGNIMISNFNNDSWF
jgi:ribonuclease T2